jgi:hypothetical protein
MFVWIWRFRALQLASVRASARVGPPGELRQRRAGASNATVEPAERWLVRRLLREEGEGRGD